jgi:hypothetical protein
MEPIALRVHEGITTHAWVRALAKQRDVRRDAGDTSSGAEWS